VVLFPAVGKEPVKDIVAVPADELLTATAVPRFVDPLFTLTA
jgi:hypothetical protein